MLSTIVSGEADLADAFFLVALIVAALGTVAQVLTRTLDLPTVAALASLAFVAAGLLVL